MGRLAGAEQMIGFAFMLAVPAVIGLASAAVLGRVLKRRFAGVPDVLRITAAIVAPIALVLLYFWIWHQIDFALHQAAGGGDYMGPMVALIYGAPIFGVLFVTSAILAIYFYAES